MVTETDVFEIIEESLKIEKGTISINSTSSDVENWDSLGQLGILTGLDKMFDGKIAGITEMAEAESVQQIIQLLRQNSLI